MIRPTGFACFAHSCRSAKFLIVVSFLLGQMLLFGSLPVQAAPQERISINDDWRFSKGDPTNNAVSLLYDGRQHKTVRRLAEAEVDDNSSSNAAAAGEPTNSPQAVIKQWILPTGNNFIQDASRKFIRPEGNLGDGVAYVQQIGRA